MTKEEITEDATGKMDNIFQLIFNFSGLERRIDPDQVIENPTSPDDLPPELLRIRDIITNIRQREPEFADVLDALIAVQQVNYDTFGRSPTWRETMLSIIVGPFSEENIAEIAWSEEDVQRIMDGVSRKAISEVPAFTTAFRALIGKPRFIKDTKDGRYLQELSRIRGLVSTLKRYRATEHQQPLPALESFQAGSIALRNLESRINSIPGLPRGVREETYVDRLTTSMILIGSVG